MTQKAAMVAGAVGLPELPRELARILGKPPVLKTESEEDFWALFNRLSGYFRATR